MKNKMFDKDYTVVKKVCAVLDDNKAENVQLIDISNSTIADYIVIATANSTVHNKALIDKVETACEAEGQAVLRRDGVADGRWIVLDCGNFLLHTFTPELREFYHLEKIWSDGKNTLDFAGVNNLPEFVPAEAEKEE